MIPTSLGRWLNLRRLGLAALLLALAVGTMPVLAQDSFRDDFTTTSWGENSGTEFFLGDWARGGSPSRIAGEARLRANQRITRSADLSTYDVATLNLRIRTIGNLDPDYRLLVQIAAASGGPWTTLQTFSGNLPGSLDLSYTIPISLLSATTSVRLQADDVDGASDFFAVDFVEIRVTAPVCFSDAFNASALNATDWATNSVSGSFGQPLIVNNRLRLTDNTGNVSTAATLRRFFPGADNRVVVEFDLLAYSGSGADGIAVTLSDGSVTPVAGGFGGSLGYAQRDGVVPGFAGGWLGVGLDAWGNFSNPTESRVGGPGSRPDSVALRGSGLGTTGFPYLAGTTTLSPGVDITGSTPGPNHRYRITVDHRLGVTGAQVSVARNTGSGFATIVPAFNIFAVNPGQAAVPGNFRLSFTGSTGGSTNIHELDNLQVCATRMDQLVEIDHFRFFHDGQGLTCEPESIVVQACLNADCTQQVSGPIQVTLSPSGWVGGDTQTITSGQTLRLQRTTAGTPALSVSASNPPRRPFTADRCFVGGVQQANCNLTYVDAGLVHEVSNHVSAVEQTVTLRAVRLDDRSQRCVPSFANVTRTVGFWQAWLNPTTGTQRIQVASGATTVSAAVAAPGTTLNLPFDANGESIIRVRYDDAGSMRLFSRYTGSAANADVGLVMDGSDDFVAKPRDFLLTVTGTGPGGATGATGPIFARAGAPFSATVTARNNSGVATPNFGREVVAEAVRLESTLQAPTAGNNPAPVAAPGFGTFVNGVATGNWRWDEVGVITLTPRLADGDYLGYGTPAQPAPGNNPDVVGAALANVGRFIPARLAVVPNVPQMLNACAAGNFGYMGQDFGFATLPELTVTGFSALGNDPALHVTRNYNNGSGAANAFWRFGGALANRSYASTATGTLTTFSRTTNGGAAVVSANTAPAFDGEGRVTVNGDRFTWAKPAVSEDPFTPQFSLALTAADLTDSDGVCFDTAALNGCDALTITGITGPAGSQQRWGRIALTSAFGPELLDLQLPMRAEFFNGTAFVANPDDVCSVVSIAPLVDANPADALLPAETCVLDTSSPGSSGQGCSVAGPLVDRRYTAIPPVGGGGRFVFWLRAPGAGNAGILDVTAIVPSFLQFNWQGSGPSAPRARVGFGVFQGDRRAIHTREVY